MLEFGAGGGGLLAVTNQDIAHKLQQHARDLDQAGGNLFRSRACRKAAMSILEMARPVVEVFEASGRLGLERLPGVGKGLGYTLEVLLRSGELRSLRPLAGTEPDRDLATLPGIGPRTLERLRDDLGLRSLEDVLAASRAGRLAELGLPAGREEALVAEARRRLRLRPQEGRPDEPGIGALLSLDAELRSPRGWGAEARTVAVERRGPWSLRATYSTTALAYRLGKTADWVTVSFQDERRSGQRLVVTAEEGDLLGLRVVRGREEECRRHYLALELESEPAA